MKNVVFATIIILLIPVSCFNKKINQLDSDYVTLAKFTDTVIKPTLKIIDIKDVPENMKANLERLNNLTMHFSGLR